MKIIVGLGNPGDKYQETRHNMGFWVADELGSRVKGIGDSWELKKDFNSEILKISYTLVAKPYTLILVKPLTYMNNSGLAVGKLVNYFKISLEDLIVIHDEIDLPLGKIKLRLGGSAAGHHGVESIIDQLKSDLFLRVRLGIGPSGSLGLEKRLAKGDASYDTAGYVLESFKAAEKTKVKQMVKKASDAIQVLLQDGLEKAQNRYH